MPSTYTNNLGLEKPATGEQAGVWGVTANNSYDFIDAATDGYFTIALSSSAYTLATSQGVDSTGRNKVIEFTGTLSANAIISIAPNTAKKIYFIRNHTIGGFSLVIQAQSSTGQSFTLQAGHSAIVYADGLGASAAVRGFTSDLQTDTLLVITSLVVQGTQTLAGAANFTAAANFSGPVTISPSLTLNVGSDAPFDIYYRSSAGPVARLPLGTNGYVLTASAAGPVWQQPAVGVTVGGPNSGGSGITGALQGPVFFGNPSKQLGQDPALIWNPGYPALGIGYSPLRQGLCIGHGVVAQLTLDSVVTSGQSPPGRFLNFSSNNVDRWTLQTDSSIESGSNTGSNLYLGYAVDDGSAAFVSFACYRVGNRVTFGANVQVPQAQVTILNQVTTQAALRVQSTGGQTAHLQDWCNNFGTIIAWVDVNGVFWTKGYNAS